MVQFKIKSHSIGEVIAEITDENPRTAELIMNALPITGKANRWGLEIYFSIPVEFDEENSRTDCEVGEIGYWPDGNGFCIFFGPTPASRGGEKPVAATPVNIFAVVKGNTAILDKVKSGETIEIEKI